MELPLKWPEPMVSVQSLSDGGLQAIPDQYVKPPPQRPTPRRTVAASIPTIDLAGLGSGEGGRQAALREISDACREWGFFMVVNHGVSTGTVRRAMEAWRGFFLLPAEEKLAFANSPKTYEGYGSRVGVEKGATLDWGDYFFLNLQPQPYKYEKWPALPSSCRDVVEEFRREMAKLAEVVMEALSASLGLEEGRLQEAFGGPRDAGACMRVNLYPKCPQPELTLGLSPHSDPGGLTFLVADGFAGGLQVRRGDGWVTVNPVPDGIIVNVGDQIQVLTNAVYKSVEHRVVVDSEEERLSIAFFYNPKGDLPIHPIAELMNKACPIDYKPMSFNEYRLFIRTKGPKGKLQVESFKAV